MDDSFIGTGKFDLQLCAGDGLELLHGGHDRRARELMMALIRENPLNASCDSLTLLDEWSGVAPPSRGEVED